MARTPFQVGRVRSVTKGWLQKGSDGNNSETVYQNHLKFGVLGVPIACIGYS